METKPKGDAGLLHALRAGFGIDQGFENGEYVAAVFDHAAEDIPQAGFPLGLAIPFGDHCRRNFNVPAELLHGMAAEKQAVEKGGLTLRVVEVVPGLFCLKDRDGKGRVWTCLHWHSSAKWAVYRKFWPRQVVLPPGCRYCVPSR